MPKARPTCGEAGGVSKTGRPCVSVWIDRSSHLCRAHDPAQRKQRLDDSRKGGRRSRSSRLSKRMQRLVQMLFKDARAAPTLDRIEPMEEYDRECRTHILMIEGQRAIQNGPGPHGMLCMGYRCQDQSMFAKAMRILRIRESGPDSEGNRTYRHTDTGTIIPQAEIARVERLVKQKR